MKNDIQITKQSDTEIQVVKTAPPVVTTNTFTLDYLNSQLAAIQAQKDDFDAARQLELDDVQAMIDEAINQGVKTSAEIDAANIPIDTTVVSQPTPDTTQV